MELSFHLNCFRVISKLEADNASRGCCVQKEAALCKQRCVLHVLHVLDGNFAVI